jgi:uncharacterized membrane protein YgcG
MRPLSFPSCDPFIEKVAGILGISPWAPVEVFGQATDDLIERARAADEMVKNFERGRASVIRNRAEGKLQENKNFPGGLIAAFKSAAAEFDQETDARARGEHEEKRSVLIRNRAEAKLRANRSFPGGLTAAFNSAAAEVDLEERAALTVANSEFQRNEYEAPVSQEERAKRIAARAAQLQKEQPNLSFLAAWRLAMRKESVPPYHVRGGVRHLDERIAAAAEGQ